MGIYCRTLFTFILIFSVSWINAQEHFVPFGDFTNAMNIHPVQASVNNINFQSGDEIGIFDGDICIGVVVLTSDLGDLKDTKVIAGSVGADDPATASKDGFLTGNTISFKIWDASERVELTNIDAAYYNNRLEEYAVDPVFEIGTTVFVSLTADINNIPVADAGNDFTIYENKTGSLNGSGSYDPEKQSLTYFWEDIDNLGINSANDMNPSFIAPEVSVSKQFRLKLTVNDGENNSLPDMVIVTVKNELASPLANAGADFEINEGEQGQLNGASSSDPNGLDLSWSWKIIPDDFVPDSPESALTSFTAPFVDSDTEYKAILTVTNSEALSAKDTVSIMVKNIIVTPVADAGPNLIMDENVTGRLDGTNSYDPQGAPLVYSWKDIDGFGLNELDVARPSFTSPEVNVDSDFRIGLNVSNGSRSSADTMVITVKQVNKKPVADAGNDKVAVSGEKVYLNGENSWDPDGDEITFFWIAPDEITLLDPTSANPEFTAPAIETEKDIQFELVVTDKWGLKDTDIVVISLVINSPPVIVTDLQIEVFEGQEITLDASSTYDPDGDKLAFIWDTYLTNEDSFAIFDDKSSPTPTVKASEVQKDRIIKLELKVSDGKERVTEIIDLQIKNINKAPVAYAGDDIVVKEGDDLVLASPGSYDPDGDNITYNWSIADLDVDAETESLILTAPEVQSDMKFPVVLVVNDEELFSEPDTLWVTVLQVNQPPEFISVPQIKADIGFPFSSEIIVSDPDIFNEIIITSAELPGWIKLINNEDGTATISADSVPKSESILGSHSFLLQASDGEQTVDTIINIIISVRSGMESYIQSSVKIYPNPATEFVTIDFGQFPLSGTIIQLYNQAGQVVSTKQANTKTEQLKIESVPAGVYHIRIKSKANIQSHKLIIR